MLAFKQWLIENFPTEELLAAELYAQALLYQNPQVQEILELTGDVKFTQDTFYKAAQLLLQESRTEKERELF